MMAIVFPHTAPTDVVSTGNSTNVSARFENDAVVAVVRSLGGHDFSFDMTCTCCTNGRLHTFLERPPRNVPVAHEDSQMIGRPRGGAGEMVIREDFFYRFRHFGSTGHAAAHHSKSCASRTPKFTGMPDLWQAGCFFSSDAHLYRRTSSSHRPCASSQMQW